MRPASALAWIFCSNLHSNRGQIFDKLQVLRLERPTMKLVTVIAISTFATISAASAQHSDIPDFSSNGTGWQSGNGGEYAQVPGSPSPTRGSATSPIQI
jgi:hypothetical protein